MPLVEISQLTKSFGTTQVLRGVDCLIDSGDVVAIIGRSGSGKSTLLRCINQLERYDGGMIFVDGLHVGAAGTDVRDLRRRVGMVFQQFNLFPHLTAIENVALAPQRVNGLSRKQAMDEALLMLDKVGLSARRDHYPSQLSGGQQQRVAIARALAMRPKILLCDEITSALDPELVAEVLKVVETLAGEGMTLILVTHEMRFARDVGSKLIFMHEGRVLEEGNPRTLFAEPQTAELRQFVSTLVL
jgi:polar amino acid transport system ATP-binding protein